MDHPEYQRIAEIAVDAVEPERQGFSLSGQGTDRVDYRLELRFDMPLDGRTRAVLAELLSQSEVTLSRRRAPAGHDARTRRGERAHQT
ncbi:MAG TPA: hypothetical protein VN848_02640 [Gemmatimonadales bacterium]|nr:hypothetical protein [Gemmatimonadales bacterium]